MNDAGRAMKTADVPARRRKRGASALVAYNPDAADDAASRQISARGGLPLLVGDSILAELSAQELDEGLQAAEELTRADLARLSGELAAALREALSAGQSSADLAEAAGNAAALFVLCLKQNGIDTGTGIAPCTVTYDAGRRKVRLKQTA